MISLFYNGSNFSFSGTILHKTIKLASRSSLIGSEEDNTLVMESKQLPKKNSPFYYNNQCNVPMNHLKEQKYFSLLG